ncbi:Transmembrane protein 50A [Desmophyllum pertusum]|uniref:Transmembrane protein 50A n=1 Tax=Desmophyllum pertusum TaxID=174260 RepID=A0A9W9YHM9_9CNID|nr:Transmembrane protein 50A [Desmophyllum pertusum]
MSGCLDHMNCPDFETITERRNLVSSVSAGALFFIGWWIMIDAAATTTFEPAYHTPGVISSLAVFMVNAVSNAQVPGVAFDGLLLLFGGLIAASWILFGAYVVPAVSEPWPGVAIFLQNALIFFSAIVFKFGRAEETW